MTPLFRHLAWLLLFASGLTLRAQTPDFLSPEVQPGGQVVFRFYAPAAHSVAVQGLRNRKPVAMVRGKDNVWTATVTGLAPDIYSYAFNVDGSVALDPRNRNLTKWITSESRFDLVGTPPPAWAGQAVPHGTLHRHTYTSAAARREASFLVYTPPGYDPRAERTYPVVYVLHGYGDDEAAWSENGRAEVIADNLLARGAMQPAILVLPNGHPRPISLDCDRNYSSDNLAAMQDVVIQELVPLIERDYRASRAPVDRAIVGLSMGGGQSLAIGLGHPELFQWVGGFSVALPIDNFDARFPALLQAARKHDPSPRLLWIAIGKDDSLLPRNQIFTAWLTQNHVPFTWKLTDGGHEWTNWRAYLEEFLGQLFR